MEYPKINSLYRRKFTETDPLTGELRYLDKGKSGNELIIGDYACEEFSAIDKWTITEKVDGTNVRIILDRSQPEACKLHFGGRTNAAQFPTFLMSHLQKTFTYEKLDEIFKESNYVVLFGEGYGPKIQSGDYYRKDVSFILFDIYCSGWWFTRESVADVAEKLGIEKVPLLKNPGCCNERPEIWRKEDIIEFIQTEPLSIIANVEEAVMEGVVARSDPQMLFRKGGPIMFKLKCKDFKCL